MYKHNSGEAKRKKKAELGAKNVKNQKLPFSQFSQRWYIRKQFFVYWNFIF
jgi:hypothetical protein